VTAILLVEDDPDLRTALAVTLRARGHHVVDVGTGTAAIHEVGHHRVDVIVLDLGLPDIDGTSVIEQVRREHDTPIIVLSARRDEVDKVRALDAGADDYMTKPFGVDELLARIRAAVRRQARLDAPRVVTTEDFTLDFGTKQAQRADGVAIHLTPTEWAVLETIVRANGLLVPTAELLHDVWGPGYEKQGNYLRVYLGQLRRKLEPNPAQPRYLITTPGIGYRFSAAG
jgi:two-component system KDP operon response regulator KdpE